MIFQLWRRKWGSTMALAYITYLKQVKQGLCCSRAEQKHLLTALEEEILDTFPDADHASLAQIEEQFGPPVLMAQELLQVLPDDAAANTAKKRMRKMCLMFSLGLLAVVLIAGGIIDGYVSERPEGLSAQAADSDFTFVSFDEGNGFDYRPDDAALAAGMKKGNAALAEAVNKAIDNISEDDRKTLMNEAITNQPAAQ